MSTLKEKSVDLVTIGSGPGGYTAAFRASDLGLNGILVEEDEKTLGGVCLNRGCIPSKALLHQAKVIEETQESAHVGLNFGAPKIDFGRLRQWVEQEVVGRLEGGLRMLAKQRKVEVVRGRAEFVSAHQLKVVGKETTLITFKQAIIAVGSRPITLPFLPDDPAIMDSTGALKLEAPHSRLLIIGGGIIGLEMATVYHALGSQITIAEFMNQLMPGADPDIVAPFHKYIAKKYERILLETKVTAVKRLENGPLEVTFESQGKSETASFDRILVAVGRRPNADQIQADKAGIQLDERGFIPVDNQMRTAVPHIYAIGDVVGNPMLAHKATAEARIAAEVIAGKRHYFSPKCIPAVAYTDPEVAWVGLTEEEAKKQGVSYERGVFPWAASGRALSIGRTEGLTKLLFDKKTKRLLGAGLVGPNAGELVSELALAIEMGCDADDIALTIHPHPTLSETIPLATEIMEGTITDLYLPKEKRGQ